MKRTLTALAAIAALTTVAPAAFAFENALAELQNQVTNELADKGYPTEFVDQLTLGELTTIRSLLEVAKARASRSSGSSNAPPSAKARFKAAPPGAAFSCLRSFRIVGVSGAGHGAFAPAMRAEQGGKPEEGARDGGDHARRTQRSTEP